MPKEVYRSAASILILRPISVCAPKGCGTRYQVLLLNKPRKRDNWQLPQGGVEGKESTIDAALRELKEEAGIDGIHVLKKSKCVYQYDFPASYRRIRPDHVCGQRIEYVLALAPADCVVRVDDHEIVGHVWVLPEEISRYVKRKEYRDFVKKLVREAASCVPLD
ncbi:NUDIX hydrolase [Candidatus Peregrinibacteria bacterium]|nr:NUDIX hydrolase [Candidatus Peregrinibacteria bacterium]